jgi:hypothetical protein
MNAVAPLPIHDQQQAFIEQPGYELFRVAAEKWCALRLAPHFDHDASLQINDWFFGASRVCNDPAVSEELEFLAEHFFEYR